MGITVREIREEDLENIMHWRMRPDVTKFMPTDPIIKMENQIAWLDNVRKDNTGEKWVIVQDDTPVGVISIADIDLENKRCSWGYYIGEKEFRSLKLAISLEMSLYDYVFDVLGLEELYNDVFCINEGVVKLHLACGSYITSIGEKEVEKAGVFYDVTHMSITKEKWESIRYNKKYEKINFDFDIKPHHIGYAVADIEQSLAKYKKLGYYQSTPIVDDISRGVKIVFLESYENKMRIELISPLTDNNPINKTLHAMKNVASPYHICYEVKNLERAIQKMKKRGFMLTVKEAVAPAINNQKVAFMINKDVGLIELLGCLD